MLRATVTLSVAVSVLAACGEGPIAPGPDTGPVTALFDGEVFIADSAAMIRVGSDVRVEASASDGRSITLDFPDLGDRNYLIGPGNPVSATVTIGASTWTADENGGGGTITVTGIFPTRIEGSFSLALVGGPGGSSLDVTQGRFLVGQ